MTVPVPGMVYRAAWPGDQRRIRLTSVTATSVAAVDMATGRPLPARIPRRQLHASPITPRGRHRTAGWIHTPEPKEQP